MIMAGDAEGTPSDSPSSRVDANASTSTWAGVGSIRANETESYVMGTGAPITSRHILTCAHLLDTDDDGTIDFSPGDVSFYLNYDDSPTSIITASALAVHPDWTGFQNPSIHDDIAIITLSSDLPADVPIYSLYTSPLSDYDTLTLVGYGESGYGDIGFSVDASLTVKRVGWNSADDFMIDDEGSSVYERFEFDFDGPSGTGEYGGGTLGNEIETSLGPGDSGGPAFILDGSEYKIAGVSTYMWRHEGQEYGTFGTGGGGMMVSAYDDWISSQAVIPAPPALVLAGLGIALVGLVRSVKRRS